MPVEIHRPHIDHLAVETFRTCLGLRLPELVFSYLAVKMVTASPFVNTVLAESVTLQSDPGIRDRLCVH